MRWILSLAMLAALSSDTFAGGCRGGRCGGGRLFQRFQGHGGHGDCGMGGCAPQQWNAGCQPCSMPNCAPANCSPTCPNDTCPAPAAPPAKEASPPAKDKDGAPSDGVSLALIEVNQERSRRGLRPFQHCRLLTQAARACASIRAARCIEGHIDDFAHLPPGAQASASGCAAWPEGMGWGSCCTYENWTYAGAAWVTGPDGRRYMHLFVR